MTIYQSGVPDRDGALTLKLVAHTLDEWVGTTKVMVVEAPSGYGKTSAVATWIHQSGHRAAWIQAGTLVDTEQMARVALIEGLIDLGLVTREDAPHPDENALLFTTVARLTERVVLVIDDVDLLDYTVGLGEVEVFCQRFPLLRILLIRSTPDPVPTVDSNAVVIGRRDLAWTPEVVRLAVERAGITAGSAEMYQDIIDRTGGRASAIAYLLRAASVEGDITEGTEAEWALERANAIDPTGRAAEVLIGMAFFLVVTEEILEWSPSGDADRVVRDLVREGLVDVAPDPRRPNRQEFRVAGNARMGLAERALARVGDGAPGLHRRAIAHFEELQRNAPIAFHLAGLGETDAAMELLTRPVGPLSSPSSVLDVRLALAAVGTATLSTEPAALAMRVMFGHVPPIERPQSRAEAELALLRIDSTTIDGLSLRDQLFVVIAMCTALTERGRMAEAIALSRPLAIQISQMTWEDMRDLVNLPGMLWAAVAEAELLAGNSRAAYRFGKLAREWSVDSTNVWLQYRAGALFAAAAAIEHNLDIARVNLQRAERAYARAGWPLQRSVYPHLIAQFLLASADLDAGELRRSAVAFGGLSSGADDFASIAAIATTLAELYDGDVDAATVAASAMQAVHRAAGLPPLLLPRVIEARVDTLIAAGRPGTALIVLDGLPHPTGHFPCFCARRAIAHLALGDPRAALQATDDCQSVPSHPRHRLASSLMVRAAAEDALGAPGTALALFAEGLLIVVGEPAASVFQGINPEWLAPLWDRLAAERPGLHASMVGYAEPWKAISAHFPAASSTQALSVREREILALLATDATLAEIAQRLFVTLNTIKSHTQKLYRKLDVAGRREAVQEARRLGISLRRDG